jgi:hypothetical protein
VVASVAAEQVAAVLGVAAAAGVPAAVVGLAAGDQCIADGAFAVPLAEAKQTWQQAIPNLMTKS